MPPPQQCDLDLDLLTLKCNKSSSLFQGAPMTKVWENPSIDTGDIA